MIEVAIQTRNEIKLARSICCVLYTARLYVSGDEGERICLSNGLCLEVFVKVMRVLEVCFCRSIICFKSLTV